MLHPTMGFISLLSIPVALSGVGAILEGGIPTAPLGVVTTVTATATSSESSWDLESETESESTLPDTSSSPFTDVEATYMGVPRAASAKAALHFLTRIPHVAGTPGDRLMAEFVSTEFTRAGIPNVSTFDVTVLLNYPRAPPLLELVEPKAEEDDDESESDAADDGPPPHRLIYRAKLSEDVLDDTIDETTDTIWRNLTFHGFGASGSVVGAHLIYANYGRPQDFAVLDAAGVSVKDRVVIVRYGQCLRGLKVRHAEQRGAVGVLIYSDPADDGYGRGPTYPEGPWRPETGIQRGTVHYSSLCGGDPARADERYRTVLNKTLGDLCGIEHTSELIPHIPSLPISYGDALPLLQNLGGPVVADVPGASGFVGGLTNLTYRLGPSRGVINMRTDHEDVITKVPNVVGVIPGSLPPDKDMPVLLGNHRDAWVYGAADPNSGTATLLEVARGLGTLYTDHNWRPLRTIYLLSWSGEEYGLLGSTGWAELNEPLIGRALAYLNSDVSVSGDKLKVAASPSLVSLWKGVMEDLNHTVYGVVATAATTATTTLDYLPQQQQHSVVGTFDNPPYGDVHDSNTRWRIPMDDDATASDGSDGILTMGSGSDYAVFLDHYGIPSLDYSFGKGVSMYGQYHSVYDSFSWMDRYGGRDGEPGSCFEIMVFSAKVWGLLALRLATTEVVPLDHVGQGRALGRYIDHIQEQAPDIDVQNLTDAVDAYQRAAAKVQVKCLSMSSDDRSESAIDECNEKLGLTERKLLMEAGLPGRPWFKHCLQAPGLDLGYGGEAFPAIQQALDVGDHSLAQEQADMTADRILAAAKNLDV